MRKSKNEKMRVSLKFSLINLSLNESKTELTAHHQLLTLPLIAMFLFLTIRNVWLPLYLLLTNKNADLTHQFLFNSMVFWVDSLSHQINWQKKSMLHFKRKIYR